MYRENEILVLTEDLGSKEKGNLTPKGTVCLYVKTIDPDGDLSKALIAIQIEDKILVTLETNIKIKSWWRRRQVLKQFDKKMMASDPRLRIYHPNIFLKAFYRVMYFFKDKIGGKDV